MNRTGTIVCGGAGRWYNQLRGHRAVVQWFGVCCSDSIVIGYKTERGYRMSSYILTAPDSNVNCSVQKVTRY